MSFDFNSYLRQTDPQHTWVITRLTGGLVNLTVRAERQDEDGHEPAEGRFGDRSLVLKYAPPYVASKGESAPFDRVRQASRRSNTHGKVEANALGLFSKPDGALSHLLSYRSTVHVPALVYHDKESHVLMLEDLGKLPPLSDHLSPSCLFTDVNNNAQSQSSRREILLNNKELCLSIGRKLGHFFADLHSKSTLEVAEKTLGHDTELARFRDGSMKDVVRDWTVAPLKGYLDHFGVPDSAELSRIVREDFERETEFTGERAFNNGDLWPGGIIIEQRECTNGIQGSGASLGPGDIKMGIIDWEFSGPGRGVNGDMAQLLAHLRLYAMAWHHYQKEGSNDTFKGVMALLNGICSSYGKHSYENGALWILGQDLAKSRYQPPTHSSPGVAIFRSTLILYGREMINIANENDWSAFSTSNCSTGTPDGLIKSMVETGASCLRAAKGTAEEFVKAENWQRLCTSEEASLLAQMFFINRYMSRA